MIDGMCLSCAVSFAHGQIFKERSHFVLFFAVLRILIGCHLSTFFSFLEGKGEKVCCVQLLDFVCKLYALFMFQSNWEDDFV